MIDYYNPDIYYHEGILINPKEMNLTDDYCILLSHRPELRSK